MSILLHGLLIGLIIAANWREVLSWTAVTQAGDPNQGKGGGGGGGGSIREVALPALERPAAPKPEVPPPPPPPVPVPTPEPEVVPPPPPEPVAAVTATPDSVPTVSTGQGGPGSGGGRGSGTGPGDGSGVGPGSGSGSGGGHGSGGAGGRGIPPEPRQLILPPLDYPKSMRGRTVAVTFWVAVDGRVERVALEPEIEDRGFAKKFSEVMRNYRFRPAKSPDGTVIPGTTTVSVTF